MGAAGYIGRVGGLAVALGVGTAIVTGAGVASATTGSESDSSNASTSTSSGTGSGASTEKSAGKTTKGPRVAGTSGRHRASSDTPAASSVTSIADRVVDTPQKPTSQSRDTASKAKAIAAALSAVTTKTTTTTDTPVVTKAQSVVKEWLASPRATAGRTADVATPSVSTAALAVFTDSVSPSTGNGPSVPIGSVGDLFLLAGARREIASAAATAAAPAYTIGVDQGVITGCVVIGCTATPDGNTYTVIGDPSKGGKLGVDPTTGQFRFLPFAPESSTNGPTGTETFKVLVAQNTAFTTLVTGLPLVGGTVIAPLIVTLQQVPVVKVVLAPLIGSAVTQTVEADMTALRGVDNAPIAFTTMVTSFDGTQISTNFFPAIGVDGDAQAGFETMLYGPGLASAGATDPTDPMLSAFRNAGYNVVTWDPRGEFASGGVLQLDSPQFEGRDVSQITTWVAGQNGVELTPDSTIPNDPQLGMVGVSYGGGIQLVTAANDHRIDAIAPGWAWNSLPGSLYPESAFRTSYSAILLLGLVTSGATINNQIYGGIVTGALLGILTPDQIALLASSGPSITVSNITAPTLLIQGTVDVLFPLQQSIINAGYLTNPSGPGDPTAITKVIWFCGGHGACLPGQGNPDADTAWTLNESLDWMDRYVKDDGTVDPNLFEWSDQNGDYWSSALLPSDPAFNSYLPPSTGVGHLLPIIPFLGGSGPQSELPLPYSLGLGTVANNAVNIQIMNPVGEGGDPVNVVGAPTVTMTYSGIGTSKHVYAQVVDKNTGLVVGNLVTPLPVTLDGQTHTQTYQLNDIAYTMYDDSDLEVQIVTSATPFLNLTEYGFINVGDVAVAMPVTTAGVPETVAV
ncbi:hypothetical protein BH09ACT7_BH09ACT7_11270 [soil metagenome]